MFGLAACVLLTAADLASRQLTEVDLLFPPVLIPVIIGLATAGLGWVAAGVRHRSWGFALTDQWVRAQWGVVIKRTATIPRNRVQILTSHSGPVDRLVGLTSVKIHTAGIFAPDITIPHLQEATVEWLREELARGKTD